MLVIRAKRYMYTRINYRIYTSVISNFAMKLIGRDGDKAAEQCGFGRRDASTVDTKCGIIFSALNNEIKFIRLKINFQRARKCPLLADTATYRIIQVIYFDDLALNYRTQRKMCARACA